MAGDPRRAYSSGAWKRLGKIRGSKNGWSQGYYEHLLVGFGFLYREGGEHRIYWDPEETANRVSVPRHGELKAYVAEQVIVAIERMLNRKGIHP
jgi:hypothetical protein